MSTPENEKKEVLAEEEESTIFSAPPEKTDKVKKGGMLKKILLSLVALCLVAAITVSVILLIPEKPIDEDDSSSAGETVIQIVDDKVFDGVDKIKLINEDGMLGFTGTIVTEQTTDEIGNEIPVSKTSWSLDGVDESLVSAANVEYAVQNFKELSYKKIISEDKNDGAGYGLESPVYTVDFYKSGEEKPVLTFTIGGETPEKSGRYVACSADSKVYYVSNIDLSYMTYTLLDFAEPEIIAPIAADSSVNNDYYSEGVLIACDKLEIESRTLGGRYVINKRATDNITTFNAYHITSPVSRAADDEKVGSVVAVFSGGIEADGCYSYTTTAKDLKDFGLDSPDFKATITVQGVVKSISATLQDDGCYAVYCPDNKTIMKVEAATLSVATLERKDLYNSIMFIESVLTLDTLKVESGDAAVVFEITTEYDEESSSDRLSRVSSGATALNKEDFQNYYSFLIGINAVSYDSVDLKGLAPTTVITASHKDGSADTVIKYYKVTDGRYAVTVNGDQRGTISSSNHAYIMKYAKNVLKGKAFDAR